MQRQLPKVGDDPEVAVLYQSHAPPLFAYLRMHTSSLEDARDLLVEIFMAALEEKRFSELRQDEQRSWLWRVARNKVADYYRAAKRQPLFSLDEVAETAYSHEELAPEQVALRREEHMQLHVSIQHLSPLQQQVLMLRFVNELRCAEIALVLGKSEGAVRMLLSRTLNLLRSIYNSTEAQRRE